MLDMRSAVLIGCCCCVLGACADAGSDGSRDASGGLYDADGASPDANAPGTDAPGTDASGTDANVEPQDSGEPDGPFGPAPTNISFETARHVELGGAGVLQQVQSAEQVDYFVLELEAGATYVLSTNTGRFAPDNVLGLYDENEELVAENDVGWLWPGDDIDARLVVRPRATGTYYLKIEDRVTPAGYFAQPAAPALFYRLDAYEIDTSTATVTWDSSDNEAPAAVVFTDEPTAGVAYVTLVGELIEGQTDTFTLVGREAQALIGHVLPGGAHGNGSTASGGTVRVLSEGDHLLASIDRALGTEQIHPPVTGAPLVLTITAEGELGDNSFYAIDLVLLPDNPPERAGEENGTLETAETLEVQGMFFRRGTMLTELPADDVDYFGFDATMGERISVVCEGASAGSGVVDLRAELRDPSDNVLGSATETLTDGLLLELVVAEETGTHYLRLSSDTQEGADLAPAWTRCAVTVEP